MPRRHFLFFSNLNSKHPLRIGVCRWSSPRRRLMHELHVNIIYRVRANSQRCWPHLARSSTSVYIRSAKRNIRNECAILIRRVKGTLREECGYTPRVCLARVTSPWNARASIGAHATRDYSPRRRKKRAYGSATGTHRTAPIATSRRRRHTEWSAASYEMPRTDFII